MACEQEQIDLAIAEADLILAEIDVAIDTLNLQLSWEVYYTAYAAVMEATYALWLCQSGGGGGSSSRTSSQQQTAPFALTVRRSIGQIMLSGNVPPLKTNALLALRKECGAHREQLKLRSRKP